MKTNLRIGTALFLAMALGACRKADATANPGEGTSQGDASGRGTPSQPLNVEEKKALAAADAEFQAGIKVLAAAGVEVDASYDASRVDAYDLDELGKSKAEVLGKLGRVPAAVLEAMAAIAEDADYNAAFQRVRKIEFVPSENALGDDFDYDASAKLEGSTLTISYAPLTSMNGGYERSVKACF